MGVSVIFRPKLTVWIDSDHKRQDWKRQKCYEEWCVSIKFWEDSKCPGWRL